MCKPNIIFVQADSMDGRLMGCLGHPALRRATPNLDRLAGRGTLFRTFFSNNPICCPSRASMLSSQYTHTCEAWNNYKGLPEDQRNLYTYFDEQNYRTALYGKTDYLSGTHTVRARVSAWTRTASIMRPAYREPAPMVLQENKARLREHDWQDVDRAARWLREEAPKSQTPFLLYVGIRAPHPPYLTNQRYLSLVDEAGVDIPPFDDPMAHPCTAYQFVSKNWEHGFSDEMVRQVRRVYFAMIAEVDAMLGEIMRAVDEQKLWDNTYFLFTSDHGELAMEHRSRQKMSMYDGSVRVPFLAAGPGIVAGQVVENLASLIDIYPTLVEMAGLPRPAGVEGHSLLPELRGQPGARPDWVLSEYTDSALNANTLMLRRGDWKYIKYVGYEPQLFHLAEDPAELRNLASSRPDVVGEMDARLLEIVDYNELDARVKGYDKRAFRRWRQEQKSAGTYAKNMALIHSGFDGVTEEQAQPWTEENERQIVAWMNS